MRIDLDSNASVIAGQIAEHGIRVGFRAQGVVQHHGMLLLAAVKRNAGLPRTGPPGPRIITGDYNRSITLEVGVLTAEVGTNKPQARRLEFGFTGTDSLGRVYDQPPYPHFGPAADEVEPKFVAALFALADDGW